MARTMRSKAVPAMMLAAALALMLTLTGCMPGDQKMTDLQPPASPAVIIPDVIINQAASEIPDTIIVIGSGKVSMKPDMGQFTAAVETFASTAKTAGQHNAKILESVMAYFLASGIDQDDMRTNNMSVYPEYDYDQSPAELVGYTARASITVTVRDVNSIGKLIDGAVSSGATRVYGISFMVSDSTEGYANALKAAIAEARIKAAAIAEALGVRLSEIPLKVTETSTSYWPLDYGYISPPRTDGGDDEGYETPISTGKLDISARVTVEYELLP